MTSPSSGFEALVSRILAERWQVYPSQAAAMGLHQYDGMVPEVSGQAIAGRVRQLRESLALVESVPEDSLAERQRFDRRLLLAGLREEIFSLDRWRDYRSNPLMLQFPLEITQYLHRSYAPLAQRVEAMMHVFRQVPGYLENVRDLLQPPLAVPVLGAAIESYEGLVGFYEKDLTDFLRQHHLGALGSEVEAARATAQAAISRFVDYLNGLKATAVPEFAMGMDLYAAMVRHGEMVELSFSQLEAAGERDLRRNQERLREAAQRLAPGQPVSVGMSIVEREHPTAERLIEETQAVLEEIRAFVVDSRVTPVVSDERPQVKETPPFMRWAFAAMDPPGPFERVATEAFYYITPVEPFWSSQQAEEWLRNFNYPTLKVIGIHEVFPGHYVHLLRERQVASDVAKAFGSYSFVEGWAHYCEEMMLEAGYGGNDPRLVVAQAKEALVRNCRFLCSLRMHTQGMTLEEATRFFRENAFAEELPAQKEALRGAFDPGYLNYTLGKLLIYKLRSDWQAEQGSGYSLSAFHETLLGHGSPPVPLLRSAMLRHDDGHVL